VESSSLEFSSVIKTHVSKDSVLYLVSIGREELKVTSEHPFYSMSKRWVKEQDLEQGDHLMNVNEETIDIISVNKIILVRPVDVYNITVSGNHNYFVTKQKILVHNK